MKKTVLTACLASLIAASSTGCIGGMALNKKVLEFNLSVAKNRWAREGVFLLLHVVPVYPIASTIDLIVVNSIEFHTGTNPVSGKPRIARAGESRSEVAPDGTVAVSTLREDGSIDFSITTPNGSRHFVNLQERVNGVAARDASGNELATLGSDGIVRSASRRTIRSASE